MWLLRNDSKGLIYRVSPGKQHIVTRKDGDMVLFGDQSISRKHAQLEIDEENGNNGIVLKDLGSKYGTFKVIGDNEFVQLSPNQQTVLRSGDTVRFGIQWNCWRAEFVHLLVTTSTLSQEEKNEVKEMVESLGGQIVNNWQVECSHLTMNKLTVTIKVVCALASAQPIVTVSYWKSFIQSLSTMQASLPDCKDFVPPLAEPMLNSSEVSFTPNTMRSKLFEGYTFVAASSKQLGRIKPMIAAAGGKTVEFSTRVWTEENLLKDKIILMLSSANERQGSQQSQVFDGYIPMARKLKLKGVRCIPESEIGLSILHCSLGQYCNPKFNSLTLLSSSDQATQRVPEESMETDQDDIETVPGPHLQSQNKKRTREDLSGDQEQVSKRPDLKENSEDLFCSPHINHPNTNDEENMVVKNNVSNEQVPVKVNPFPSIDMFASPGEKSGPSNVQKRSAIKPSCEDMFATSGSRSRLSNVQKQNAVIPSCEDMFATSGDKSGRSNVQKRNAVIPSCEDMFASTGSSKQELKNLTNDEFSFPPARNTKEPFVGVVDEFSFESNKTSNKSLNLQEKEDVFSFDTVKKPVKRNRQSNPDRFLSRTESSTINDTVSGPSKNLNLFGDGSTKTKQNEDEDSLFVFSDDHNSKRRRINDTALDLNKLASAVKLPCLANGCEAEPGPSYMQQDSEDQPEAKSLITYSKLKERKAVENGDVDELADDLCNATIVTVKPLVVKNGKQLNTTAPDITGKNFKKFRKVVGLNKRVIPHIIGGRDLVPHYNVGHNSDKTLSSPVQNIFNDNDDDWTFDQNKINKRIH